MTDALTAAWGMIENMEAQGMPGSAVDLIDACWAVDDHATQAAHRAAVIANLAALPERERLFAERIGTMPVENLDPGIRRPGEDTQAHIARNLAYPPTHYALAGIEDDVLPGIRDIMTDPVSTAEDRVGTIAAIPDASAWIDRLFNGGSLPSDTRAYYPVFDGEKRYDIIERGTQRFVATSKLARWSHAMASIFSAFPHFVDPYIEARGSEQMDALCARIADETADWRKTDPDCIFYDPFEPTPPFDMTRIETIIRNMPDDSATADGDVAF